MSVPWSDEACVEDARRAIEGVLANSSIDRMILVGDQDDRPSVSVHGYDDSPADTVRQVVVLCAAAAQVLTHEADWRPATRRDALAVVRDLLNRTPGLPEHPDLEPLS